MCGILRIFPYVDRGGGWYRMRCSALCFDAMLDGEKNRGFGKEVGLEKTWDLLKYPALPFELQCLAQSRI